MIPQIASFTGTGRTVGEAIDRAEARANGWLATAGITGEQALNVSAQTFDVQGKASPADHWMHSITIMYRTAQPLGVDPSPTTADVTGDAPDPLAPT